jgi:hypothetical protein
MNNKGKGSAKKWTQTKARGGSGIVVKNKSRRIVKKSKEKNVEYLAVG